MPPSRTAVDRRTQAEAFLAVFPDLRRRLTAGFSQELRDELDGATVHQLEAVAILTRRGELTMNDLARCQGTGLSSATALADRLIRQGLAERCHDPHDRRVVRLVATDTARRLIERFHTAKLDAAVRALEDLSGDEAETFLRLLRRVAGVGDETGG